MVNTHDSHKNKACTCLAGINDAYNSILPEEWEKLTHQTSPEPPPSWILVDDDDWNRFDANGLCDQVSWRGKRSESDQNDRWNYVNFNHYHLAIYQSDLLVFGHRSPVSWPSTHPIPTWGRFPKRIHRKVFCRPMFNCPVSTHPSPTLILSLAFDLTGSSAWGGSKSK